MHPILFSTEKFTLYTYGVCVAVAGALAFFLTSRLARAKGVPAERAADVLLLAFIAGIAGARLFYVLQHFSDYEGRWKSVFVLQEGGLVWYGGFLGAAAATWLAAKRLKSPFLAWADFFSPILPAAHAVGRVGCFLNGCCLGKNGLPVQLIESAALILLSFGLFRRYRTSSREGAVFSLYLAAYGSLRFLLEFLRAGQETWFLLTLPQWMSLACIAAAFCIRKRSCRAK